MLSAQIIPFHIDFIYFIYTRLFISFIFHSNEDQHGSQHFSLPHFYPDSTSTRHVRLRAEWLITSCKLPLIRLSFFFFAFAFLLFPLQSSDSPELGTASLPVGKADAGPPAAAPPTATSGLDDLDLLGKTLLQQSLPPESQQVRW